MGAHKILMHEGDRDRVGVVDRLPPLSSTWPIAISTISLPSWIGIARPFEATGGHMPEPRNGGRSGCFCCSATHELASASLLKPVYLPGTVPSSLM
jgi:hypothetical protein